MATMKQEYILQAKYMGKGELGEFQGDLKALGKIGSIKKLGKEIRELNTRFDASKKKLEAQAREMRNADKVTKEMTRSYKSSQREVTRLATALDKKKKAFATSTAVAREAGINTRNLTAEEKRLAIASKATGKVWAARKALGVKSHRDIRYEVKRLGVAYNDLKRSGKATALELFQAKQKLREKTRQLIADTHNWGSSLDRVRMGAVALAGVGYAMIKVFREFAGFESGMAEVYTLLDLSTEQFRLLKKEAKGIMGDLPQESKDLTKALYDIISAGIDVEKSNLALEKSARAAVAGVTDTNTAVKIGVGAMNAYNKEVDDLDQIYDILFQTVKSGVTTFPELAQNMGEILPVARAADVELYEVSAAIAALTKAGIKTPQAATALKGAIRAMAAPAPEARVQFEKLGITWDGLLPTLEAIAEKSLSIDQMRMLIPDVEASTGILSLTQNLDGFKEILGSMDSAAGSMEVAYEKMADTPEHDIKKMMKSVSGLTKSLGEFVSWGVVPAANVLGWLADQVNDSNVVVKTLLTLIGATVTATALWKLGLGSVVTSLGGMVLQIHASASAMGVYSGAVAAARIGVARLTAVMAANPVGAAVTAIILAAGAAWLLFGENSLKASRKHSAAAKTIGDGRKAIDKEVAALERLQDTLRNTEPASKEYVKAERELAALLPGANIALDEHGRMIARVGDASSENAKKLDVYLGKLREGSRLDMALQLEEQVKAYQKAGQALDEYKGNMSFYYGISEDGSASNIVQDLVRNINKLTGTYGENKKAGAEAKIEADKQKKAYDNLIQSFKQAGVSADEMSVALDKAKISAELKQSILADYGKLEGAIEDVADAAEKSALEQEKSFADAARSIKDEYAQLAQEVKRILDEIAGRQQSLTEELRDMTRSGMSDGNAWKDLKKEADEYYQAAEDAAAAGDFDKAVKLADKAKSKYRELNSEVKENDKVVVSAEKARKTAMEGVEKAGQLAIETLREQEQVARDSAEEFERMAGSFADGWKDAFDMFVSDGTAAISTLESSLDELIRDREIKLNIVQTESKQFGGMVGLKMMLGGLLERANVQQLAGGGPVYNALSGLRLPGYGGGDRRWILGEDGEVMIRKESVKMAGARAALAFNAGRWDVVVSELTNRFGLNVGDVVRRQFGGIIDSVNAVTSPHQMMAAGGMVQAAGSGPVIRHQHTIQTMDGRQATVYADDLNSERLVGVLQNAWLRSS